MTIFEALFMALLQGITELFPVSSLGHAVIVPKLLGWPIDERAPEFLPYLVVMHFGTATALLLYFWRDWLVFLKSAVFAKTAADLEERHTVFMLVVATLPAAIVGFALRKLLGDAFASPPIAAVCLILNGAVLLATERLRAQAAFRVNGRLALINAKGALLIGLSQCCALVPGISRSGFTLVSGLLIGLKVQDAARFSFLMATPIIFGATLAEAPKLFLHSAVGASAAAPAISGFLALLSGLVAGLAAFASAAFLMAYFKTHEEESLSPFGWYCLGAGFLSLVWLLGAGW